MRLVTVGAGGLLTVAMLAVGAGCATSDQAKGCDRSKDVDATLDDLDQLAETETDANNLDERLEHLGDDINKVMNTSDDENALQLRDLQLKYQDVRDQLDRLGNADSAHETGVELRKTLRELGDAIHRMSDATKADCAP
jgi:chromosome segregation ATPase